MNKIIKKKAVKGIIVFVFFFIYLAFAADIPLIIFHIEADDIVEPLRTIYLLDINIILLCTIFLLYYKDLANYIKHFKWEYITKNIKYWLMGIGIMILTTSLIAAFSPVNMPENEKLVRELIKAAPIYMVISTAILGPIMEETIFRKAISDIFDNTWLFIIVSGLIFGASHIVFSIKSVWDFLYIIPYGALGSLFAYVFTKTKNLLAPISLHIIHNSILLFIYFMIL